MAEIIVDHTRPGAQYNLTSDVVCYLELGLRGVTFLQVRFLGPSGSLESDLLAFLASRDIQVKVDRLAGMAPLPRRRFSFRYEIGGAVLTVFSDGELRG